MGLLSVLKNKEIKNAGWLIGGKVAQMALSVVVGALTARYLGPSNYGLINYGTAFVSFFTALSTLGLNSVIIKDFIDNPKEQGEAIGSAILMRLASSVLSAIMIVSIVGILDHDEPLTIAVVALCSVSLIFHVFETINYWFQSQYRSNVTAIITLLGYAVTSGYKIVLLALGKDIRWFAFATSVDYIVVAILLLFIYKRYNGAPLRFSLNKAKSLLKSSYHYIFSSMMVAIYGQTDKLMLKKMLDESEVAYYSIATTICSMWVFVLAAIIDSVYPTILTLHKTDRRAFERKNRQLYALVFYISCFVSILLVIFGKWGITFLYGEAYIPSTAPLMIITWYTAFSYLGVARNAWIVSEEKQKYLKYMYGCAAVMNVVLNLIFIPILGASGAALASLITQISTSIILPACIKDTRPNVKLMIEAILLKGIIKK